MTDRSDVPPSHQLGDAPIQDEYRKKMNSFAYVIDEYFNGEKRGHDRRTGFVMIVFEFGTEGRANYISNANRADVVRLLREQLARFEAQPEGNA